MVGGRELPGEQAQRHQVQAQDREGQAGGHQGHLERLRGLHRPSGHLVLDRADLSAEKKEKQKEQDIHVTRRSRLGKDQEAFEYHNNNNYYYCRLGSGDDRGRSRSSGSDVVTREEEEEDPRGASAVA